MNTLFSLIKTLNKSEKRRFKLNSFKQSGQNQYLILFELMELCNLEKKEYNEVKLMSQLEEIGFFKKNKNQNNNLKYFRVIQSYLKDQILGTLRGLYETEEKNSLVTIYLLNAKIANRKGLGKLAEKEIKKAITLALKFELTADLFSIKRQQIGMAHYTFDKDTTKKVDDLHKEIEELLEQMMIETKYSKLFNKLYHLYLEGIRYSKNTSELKSLYEKVMALNLEVASKNFHTNYVFYAIKGFFSLITNNLEKALENLQETLRLWEERKEFIKEYPMRYQMLLANCLNICIVSNKYDSYVSLLKKMKKLKTHHQRDHVYNEIMIMQIEQLRILNTSSFDEAIGFVKKVDHLLLKYKDKVTDTKWFNFQYNTMILYFMMEDYKNALIRSKKLLAFKNKKTRKDLRGKTIVLYLIFLYERNNKKDLANLLEDEETDEYWDAINGAIGKLRRQKQHNELHKLIQHFLWKMTVIYSPEGIKREFYVMRSKLFELREKIGQENIGGLGLQETLYWIESKVTGKSIQNIIEEDRNSDDC